MGGAMRKLKCYLAGPVAGLTWAEAIGWRRKFAAQLRRNGFEPLVPCEAEKAAEDMGPLPAADNEAPGCSNFEVFRRDVRLLEEADVLVVNLRGAKERSIGTAWEIGWAWAQSLPIIAVVQPGDVNWHCFVEQSCTIVPTLGMALRMLKIWKWEETHE